MSVFKAMSIFCMVIKCLCFRRCRYFVWLSNVSVLGDSMLTFDEVTKLMKMKWKPLEERKDEFSSDFECFLADDNDGKNIIPLLILTNQSWVQDMT